MALLIPDITILDTCNKILTILRNDYNDNLAAGTESRSMLYLLFNSLTIGRYDFYESAKKAIITTKEDPRHIDAITLSFNQDSPKFPAMYLTLPAESTTQNSLGLGIGDVPEEIVNNPWPEQDEIRSYFNRRYVGTYYLVIVTDNRNEVSVLYQLFKNMLVVCTTHLAMLGIENLKIGGQDLRLNEMPPDKVFMKAITLNFDYEQHVPNLSYTGIFDKLRLYWKPEGAEVRNGPIIIDSDDSDSDSLT